MRIDAGIAGRLWRQQFWKNMTLIISARDEFRSALEAGAIKAAEETGILRCRILRLRRVA